MASYDTSYESQVHSNLAERPLRLSWSGIIGGTARGWGIFSLLSLIGAAIGFAKFDPYSAQPASGLGAGSGVFGIIALIASSFLGAFFAVRIAGSRERNDALFHGGICWALSMLIGAVLAIGAARTAAQSAASVAAGPRAQAKVQRESNLRDRAGGPTAQDRERASEAADTAAKSSGAAAGGARERLASAQNGLGPALANLRALPKATKIKIGACAAAIVLFVGGLAVRGNAAAPVVDGPPVRTSDLRPAPAETRQAARNYAVAKAEQANGSYRAAAENYANAARQGNKRALTKLVAMTHAKKCEARSEAADALGTLRGKKAKLALKKLAHAKFKDEARNPGIFSCSSRRAAQKALERQARG